jgi:hypothetical protein
MKIPQQKSIVRVTTRLSREILEKARALAARRATTISKLLAEQIESLVGDDAAYQCAERRALALLDRGFSLGGGAHGTRDECHER